MVLIAREVADRLEIQDLMHRYASVVDFRQWEKLDQVFAPDATVDYTSTGGKKGHYRSVMAWLDRALEPWPINLHFITNLVLDFDGDAASSQCYFHAPMGRPEEDGSQHIITNSGLYRDRLVRTPQGWRIAERICQQTLMLGSLPDGYVIPD